MAQTVNLSASFVPVGTHTGNSSLSSAVVLTPPTGAHQLLIQALTQNIRYTLDGTTPAASVGFVLTAGADPVLIVVGDGMTVTIIQATSGAVAQYQWGA